MLKFSEVAEIFVQACIIVPTVWWLCKKEKEICGDKTPEEKLMEVANELAEKKRKEWNKSR